MQPTMNAASVMRLLKRLRGSTLWRQMSDEQFTPEADLLSDVWRTTRSSSMVTLVAVPVLVLLAFGIPFPKLAPVGQLSLFAAAVLVAPAMGIEFIYRRWGANPTTGIIGRVMFVLAPLNAFVALLLGPHVPPVRGMLDWAGIWGYLAVGSGAALLTWFVLVARSHILGQLRAQVERERTRADDATRERQLVEAKLQNLQAQIEPHFLYNTLANVQHLIAHRPADAEAMLTGLIRYLRESLPKMRSTCSSLEQEFALAAAYLDIARIRLGGRLTVDVGLPGELKTCAFPPLVIQTLVENALKHGIEPKVGPASIRIGASAREDKVCVWVADDGVGLGVVQGTGVGLRNTRERLAAIYGPKAALTLAPNTPGGFVATVCIPRESA